MTLPLEDGKLFFELMWGLQYYANQQRGINADAHSVQEYANVSTEKKLEARDALWEHPELIDAYVRENPNGLTPEKLAIVEKWKGLVKGTFYILRHLKKGSIFLADNLVYSVHGVLDPLDEIIPAYALPRMVNAVLLPFKGQIIYDGLLQGYSINFGSGIRSNLNQIYTVAKQKERIITTLEPALVAPKVIKARDAALPQLKMLSATMAKLKGDGVLQSSALNLARLCLSVASADAEGIFPPEEIQAQARKISRASTRLLNLLNNLDEE